MIFEKINRTHPIRTSIPEIKSYFKTLKTVQEKVHYIEHLRHDLCLLCYNASDTEIEKFQTEYLLKKDFLKSKNRVSILQEITHITSSEYADFLCQIDEEVLPFVRLKYFELNEDYTEDYDFAIRDYPTFDFKTDRIREYHKNLGKEQRLYHHWLNAEYKRFKSDNSNNWFAFSKKNDPSSFYVSTSRFGKELALELYKNEVSYSDSSKKEFKINDTVRINTRNYLYKTDKTIFNFVYRKILNHSRTFNSFHLKYSYLTSVLTKARTYKELFNSYLDYISFKNRLEKYTSRLVKTEIKSKENLKTKKILRKAKKSVKRSARKYSLTEKDKLNQNKFKLSKKLISAKKNKPSVKLHKSFKSKLTKKSVKSVKSDKGFSETYISISNPSVVKGTEELNITVDSSTQAIPQTVPQKSVTSGIKNSDKIIWVGTKEQLKLLLIKLQNNDFIENILTEDKECLNYLSCFVDKNFNNFSDIKPDKIRWNTNASELAYLIGELTKSKSKSLIHGSKKWVITSKVFKSQYNTEITPGSLRSSYNKKTISANQNELNRIIEAVCKTL